jgi:hypothetical protein
LEFVQGNCFARVKNGFHREPGPDVDHAEKFVDHLLGILGAPPPSGWIELIGCNAMNDG